MAVDGSYDPAFAPLAEVFRASVTDGAERGSLCLRVDGQTVLNLWGGLARPETGTAWQQDTLACCFSVTKGVFALLAHNLIDRGLLDPDSPVAELASWVKTNQICIEDHVSSPKYSLCFRRCYVLVGPSSGLS